MPRLKRLKDEAETVVEKIGYFIPPYEWADMMKLAGKIANILTAPAATTMTYRKALIILEIVEISIKKMLAEEDLKSFEK